MNVRDVSIVSDDTQPVLIQEPPVVGTAAAQPEYAVIEAPRETVQVRTTMTFSPAALVACLEAIALLLFGAINLARAGVDGPWRDPVHGNRARCRWCDVGDRTERRWRTDLGRGGVRSGRVDHGRVLGIRRCHCSQRSPHEQPVRTSLSSVSLFCRGRESCPTLDPGILLSGHNRAARLGGHAHRSTNARHTQAR